MPWTEVDSRYHWQPSDQSADFLFGRVHQCHKIHYPVRWVMACLFISLPFEQWIFVSRVKCYNESNLILHTFLYYSGHNSDFQISMSVCRCLQDVYKINSNLPINLIQRYWNNRYLIASKFWQLCCLFICLSIAISTLWCMISVRWSWVCTSCQTCDQRSVMATWVSSESSQPMWPPGKVNQTSPPSSVEHWWLFFVKLG